MKRIVSTAPLTARTSSTDPVTCTSFHFWEPLIDSEQAHPRVPDARRPAIAFWLRIFRVPLILTVLFILAAACSHAAPTAIAQFTDISLGGGEFKYQITLDNIGATNIGTFWNAWIPGEDFMAVSPTNITSPTGWTDNITGGGGSDGYAIQWVASSNLIAPSASGTFSFESTVTPAAMDGDSVFYPSTPVETSFVYSGAPFSDAGDEFVVQPAAAVPEPRTWALGALAALCLIPAIRRRVRTA